MAITAANLYGTAVPASVVTGIFGAQSAPESLKTRSASAITMPNTKYQELPSTKITEFPRQDGKSDETEDQGDTTTAASEEETDALSLIPPNEEEINLLNKLWSLYGGYDDVAAAALLLEILSKDIEYSQSFEDALTEFTNTLSQNTHCPEVKAMCQEALTQLAPAVAAPSPKLAIMPPTFAAPAPGMAA